LREELGIIGTPEYFFESEIRNEIESENVTIYKLFSDGPFEFAPDEIDEIRFWDLSDFQTEAGCKRSDFTPNLQVELQQIVELLKK
jgi:isopentenyldiphosphate isomerase